MKRTYFIDTTKSLPSNIMELVEHLESVKLSLLRNKFAIMTPIDEKDISPKVGYHIDCALKILKATEVKE